MALLSGARNEKNVHLSEIVYNRMKKLFPNEPNAMLPAAVLLANVCESSGENDKASNIRIDLHELSLKHKKKVGLSWTSVNGQVYVSL